MGLNERSDETLYSLYCHFTFAVKAFIKVKNCKHSEGVSVWLLTLNYILYSVTLIMNRRKPSEM